MESYAVQACTGRLRPLRVLCSRSVLCGAFVWLWRALNSPTRWLVAGQKGAELADVHLGPDHEIAQTLNTSRDAAVKVAPRACVYTYGAVGVFGTTLTKAIGVFRSSFLNVHSRMACGAGRLTDGRARSNFRTRRRAAPRAASARASATTTPRSRARCSAPPPPFPRRRCMDETEATLKRETKTERLLTSTPRAGLARGRLQPAVDVPEADPAVSGAKRLQGILCAGVIDAPPCIFPQ
jgi:hypothetical protein